jgi:hypothetical protein
LGSWGKVPDFVHEPSNFIEKDVRCEIGFLQHPACLMVYHGLSIADLMIMHRERKGDKNGKDSSGDQLSNGTGTGSGDGSVGDEEGIVHVLDKRDSINGDEAGGFDFEAFLDFVVVRVTGSPEDLKITVGKSIKLPNGIDNGGIDATRSLASSGNQESFFRGIQTK